MSIENLLSAILELNKLNPVLKNKNINTTLDEFNDELKRIPKKVSYVEPIDIPRITIEDNMTPSDIASLVNSMQQERLNALTNPVRDPIAGIQLNIQVIQKFDELFNKMNMEQNTYFSGEALTKYNLLIVFNSTF